MSKLTKDEVRGQAREWFVRMRSPVVSEKDRRAHADWLAQAEEHRSAYDAVEREWRELAMLDVWASKEIDVLRERMAPQPKQRIWHFGIAGALGAAMLTIIVMLMWLPLSQQPEKEHYSTMKGEQRRIVLEDGSSIHLNSASAVEVKMAPDVRQVQLLHGEGLFDVARERGRPFVVRVRDRDVVAVGTVFNVHYEKEKIAITVLEGKVAVSPKAGRQETQMRASLDPGPDEGAVLLESDQQLSVDERGEMSALKVIDAGKVTAWNRGLLVFDRTPLQDVAEEMSRYIVGHIEVVDDATDYLVTGVIKIRDEETMLQLLSEVVPIVPVRQSMQVTMLYPIASAKPEATNAN